MLPYLLIGQLLRWLQVLDSTLDLGLPGLGTVETRPHRPERASTLEEREEEGINTPNPNPKYPSKFDIHFELPKQHTHELLLLIGVSSLQK